jgi:hypothetical protein
MLDYAQSFEEFSSSLKPMDLALYAGAGIVLWVLFKDKLSPVQKFLGDLLANVKTMIGNQKVVEKPVNLTSPVMNTEGTVKSDVFFDLVASWKQTRDLAVKSGCDEAVKVADQMFPYLSPQVCNEEKV